MNKKINNIQFESVSIQGEPIYIFYVEADEHGLYNLNHITKNIYNRDLLGKQIANLIKAYNWKRKEQFTIQTELDRNDNDYNEIFVYRESDSKHTTLTNRILAKKYYEWCVKEIKEYIERTPIQKVVEQNEEKIVEEKKEQTTEELLLIAKKAVNDAMEEYIKLCVMLELEATQSEYNTNKNIELEDKNQTEIYYSVGHYWNDNVPDKPLNRDALLRIGRRASNLAEIYNWKLKTCKTIEGRTYKQYPESNLQMYWKEIYGDVDFGQDVLK